MVKLNLLPPEERTKKQVIKGNFIAVFLLTVLLSMLAAFNFYLLILKSDSNNKMAKAEENITLQQKNNDKYKGIEDIITSLNSNMDLLQKLKNSGIAWSSLLDEIKNNIPKEAILEEITTSIEGEGTKNEGSPMLTIKGYSPIMLPVARFRETLASSTSIFEYVNFQSAIRGDQTDNNDFKFTLQLKIKKQSNGK